MTHAPPQTMVVSYGARDEDDEYDSENERQGGIFGMLQQNKRGSQGQLGGAGSGGGGGLGSMIEKLGASMTFTKDGNDSDEGSVVVRTFKKVGKKMKKMGKKRNKDDDDDDDDSSSSEEESSDEEDSDSDDEEETSEDDSEMEDRSISKRMGKAAMKMTGKFTKGFLGRSKDDSISSDEEEDPLFNMDNNNNNNRRNNFGFGFGKKKQDSEIQASSERRRRASNIEHSTPAFRRSNTDGPTAKRGPGRSKSTDHTYYEDMKKKNLARSHTQEAPRSPRKERTFAKSEAGLSRAAARAKAHEEFMEPAEAVWSMNVTEKMLEEAAKKGEFVPPAAGRRNKC